MDLCLSTLWASKARQPNQRVVPTLCPGCRRLSAFAVNGKSSQPYRPKRKKTPSGSRADILPGFSVNLRTAKSLHSWIAPSPTAHERRRSIWKSPFLRALPWQSSARQYEVVPLFMLSVRPLLSWQCPKGHFLDFRLSPTAHGRFIRSGLPQGSRYLLTPNRRLLTLREIFQSVFTVSALSLRYSPLKSFRIPFMLQK